MHKFYNMSYELVGKLYKKFDTESKSSSFQAREFVLETIDSNYTQYIKFQLTQDRCGLIENYNVGDEVKVHFDLRGREWNEKFFTNLNAWKIEGNTASAPPPAADFPANDPFPQESFPTAPEQQAKAEDFDDLPF